MGQPTTDELETRRTQRSTANQIVGYLRQQGEEDAAEKVEHYRDTWIDGEE